MAAKWFNSSDTNSNLTTLKELHKCSWCTIQKKSYLLCTEAKNSYRFWAEFYKTSDNSKAMKYDYIALDNRDRKQNVPAEVTQNYANRSCTLE